MTTNDKLFCNEEFVDGLKAPTRPKPEQVPLEAGMGLVVRHMEGSVKGVMTKR